MQSLLIRIGKRAEMLANVPEPPGGANDRRSGAPISAGSARSRLLAAVFVRRFEAQVGAGAGEGGAVIAPGGIRQPPSRRPLRW